MSRDSRDGRYYEAHDKRLDSIQLLNVWAQCRHNIGKGEADGVHSTQASRWSTQFSHQEAQVLPSTQTGNIEAVGEVRYSIVRVWEENKEDTANDDHQVDDSEGGQV